ncbi:MAG TPA: Ig-like domain repeat protein [Pseudolabrys sp.]|nr:Ig-like domain repeat protein [Pseudolabrys sp.]
MTFTATVTPSVGGGTPTGTVVFMEGGTTLATSALSGGTATYTTNTLSAGSHSITATYNSDLNYQFSQSSAVSVSVTNGTTTAATVRSSLSPSNYLQTVTFTATVGSSSPATGTITLYDGASAVGTTTANVFGAGSPLVAGDSHTCAVTSAGGVKCWGNNAYGQLGNATNSQTFNPNPTPLDVAGLSSGVVALAAGAYHTCALTSAGGVKCWGSNTYGQLGNTTNNNSSAANPTPVDVPGLSSGVVALTAGLTHTCALTSAGGVKCWGSNYFGQLGNATNTGNSNPNPTPVNVAGLSSGVVALAAGTYHTCALTSAGGVKCWGSNVFGQLGTTTNSATGIPNPTPLDVTGLSSGVIAIAAGGGSNGPSHTCALTNSGGVKCWGSNSFGELGNTTGSGGANPTPLDVTGLTDVAAISAGGAHSCAILTSGAGVCWGYNGAGQLGNLTNSATSNANPTPLSVDGGSANLRFIAAGGIHTCSVDLGDIRCWGLNYYGQLGVSANNGSNADNPYAYYVTGFDAGGAMVYSNATFSTVALNAGSHSMSAYYSGDGNHNGGSSPALTQTVNQISSSTSLGSSQSTTVFGQSASFTATVTSSNGTPTGAVSFYDGANLLGTSALSGGIAGFSTAALGVGTHTIVATYVGDNNYTGSFSTNVTQTVNQGASSTAVVSSASLSSLGHAVTFTAIVTATAPADGVPGGTVTFYDGANSIGIGTLSGGTATYSTSALSVGVHFITAVYAGDTNFMASTSSLLGQAVYPGTTTTSLGAAPSPSVFGQAVTFTATVASGAGTPTGTVNFMDGANSIGTGSLTGGIATLTTASLAVGGHAITAVYGGDASFAASQSFGASQTVSAGPTTTALSTLFNPSVFGQSLTFTATVSAASPASGTPTGTVSFKDGATTLGTGTLSGGAATLQTSALSVGSHTITAVYGGDSDFVTSTSTGVVQTVNKGATTITGSASPATIAPGAAVTLKATVDVTSPASATPSGQVTFEDKGATLGIGTIAAGVAQVTANPVPIGVHTITASYGGDGDLAASSATTAVTVSAAVGPETRVNTTTAGSQQLPGVAALKSGYVVAWASNGQDGSGYGIFAQRYTAGGAKAGKEFAVNTATVRDQTSPAIAGLSDGGFVIVWQSNGEDGSGYGIYGQRFKATGAKLGAEFKINTTTKGNQMQPSVAALSGGGFVVAWTSKGQDGSGLGVYAQRYDATGTAQGGESLVNQATAGDQSMPSIAALTGGGFVIAWQSEGQDGSGLGIYARRYDATGKAQSGEFKVNTVTVNDQSRPSIAALHNGGFVIAWQSALQDSSGLGVYLQRYTAKGIRAGGETRVNTTTVDDQGAPRVANFSDGGYVVVWASNNQDGSGEGVYAQAFKDTGARVNVEFRVNTTTALDQYQPAAAGFASGNFVAVWTSQSADGSLENIFAQRFALPGTN